MTVTIAKQLRNLSFLVDHLGRKIKLMEVCGTHTMTAFRSGLRSLLPRDLVLLSGPGCPVCVTPNEYIDKAIAIAFQPGTLVTTFGDMVRVPGSESSLERARAQGAQIQVVYSPMDALVKAKANPHLQVVFLGVGFETTIPTIAWTIKEAANNNINNFFVLCGHKTIPNAMHILMQGDVNIDGFLCPGHVSVIIGAHAYNSLCAHFQVPCVITGFEASDMVSGIEMILTQLLEKAPQVEIQYSRSVTENGNKKAQLAIREVFEECDTSWRGLGIIKRSGLKIREIYKDHDADIKFTNLKLPKMKKNPWCICGEILKGCKSPVDCSLFKTKCSPDTPFGPCMVSTEGTCAAYFKYAEVDDPQKI